MKKNQKHNRNNNKLFKLNKQLIILFKKDRIKQTCKMNNSKIILSQIN